MKTCSSNLDEVQLYYFRAIAAQCDRSLVIEDLNRIGV